MGTTQPPREPRALRPAGSPQASARPQATLCPVGDRTLGGPAPHPAFRDCPAPPSQPSWFFSFGLGRPAAPPAAWLPVLKPQGKTTPRVGGTHQGGGRRRTGHPLGPLTSTPPHISWHRKLSSSKSRQPTSPDRPLHAGQSPLPLAVPGPGTWVLALASCHEEPLRQPLPSTRTCARHPRPRWHPQPAGTQTP